MFESFAKNITLYFCYIYKKLKLTKTVLYLKVLVNVELCYAMQILSIYNITIVKFILNRW